MSFDLVLVGISIKFEFSQQINLELCFLSFFFVLFYFYFLFIDILFCCMCMDVCVWVSGCFTLNVFFATGKDSINSTQKNIEKILCIELDSARSLLTVGVEKFSRTKFS